MIFNSFDFYEIQKKQCMTKPISHNVLYPGERQPSKGSLSSRHSRFHCISVFFFFFFPLMASLVSVTRYRKQIPWNNDFPVMVTNFNMLESISSELILVPRICTSFDWSRATLTFIKSITIKTESMLSFIYAISKIIRFMLFFTYYKFLNSDIPQNQQSASICTIQAAGQCQLCGRLYCLKWAGLAITIHRTTALCVIYIASMRCIEFSCLFKCSQK